MRPLQVLIPKARVNLGVMATKGLVHTLQSWSFTIEFSFVSHPELTVFLERFILSYFSTNDLVLLFHVFGQLVGPDQVQPLWVSLHL